METQPLTHPLLAASLICADLLDLREIIHQLELGSADYIHFDVMDGTFVGRYGLFPELLQSVASITRIPVDVHMMVANPEPYIPVFARSGARVITVHAEGNHHLHRTAQMVRDAGCQAGVALNPATPLSALDHVLDDLDLVLLMAINPGVLHHPVWPGVLPKIKALRALIQQRGLRTQIEIDGGVTPVTLPQLTVAGADILVCGSGTIFRQPLDIAGRLQAIKAGASQAIATQRD